MVARADRASRSQPSSRISDWTGDLRLETIDKDGVLTRAITGSLLCSSTGWRMSVTGTADGRTLIHLTAQFDGPTYADEAAPWTDEHELAKPHEDRLGAYVCFWTGTIRSTGADAWQGVLADRYGGRLLITGKRQNAGLLALRATSLAATASTLGRGQHP